MSSYIRQRLKAYVSAAKQNVDPEARDIIDDLVNRIYPVTAMKVSKKTDEEFGDCVGFDGKNCGVVIGNMSNALPKFLEELKSLQDKQFATFSECRRYCEGTKHLLGILTMYHNVLTPKTLVVACPDASVWRNGKASFLAEDRKEHYGKKRSVFVSVIYQDGFLAFAFDEEVAA